MNFIVLLIVAPFVCYISGANDYPGGMFGLYVSYIPTLFSSVVVVLYQADFPTDIPGDAYVPKSWQYIACNNLTICLYQCVKQVANKKVSSNLYLKLIWVILKLKGIHLLLDYIEKYLLACNSKWVGADQNCMHGRGQGDQTINYEFSGLLTLLTQICSVCK